MEILDEYGILEFSNSNNDNADYSRELHVFFDYESDSIKFLMIR